MDNGCGKCSRTSYRCEAPLNSSSVGFGLVRSLYGRRLHYRTSVVVADKRCYSTSYKPKYGPPKEWLPTTESVLEKSVMRQALLPTNSFLPGFALQVKTVRGVIPEVCSDESTFLLNYDPYEYVKARPLFERKGIHGSQCNVSGDQPFIWLPFDYALYLIQSLPLLAHFFHEQGVCLPRLSLNDLAISGAGTFRLRGIGLKFREWTPENVKDVYNNIRTLLRELIVASVGPGILKQPPEELDSLFQLMRDCTIEQEYLICYHSFYIPLSNKCSALLRIVDKLIQLPTAPVTERCIEYVLPTGMCWQTLARSNGYLELWLDFRKYGFGRRQFFLYLRAVIVHKLEHTLPDKFVDFLLYAIFQKVLMNLQKTLWEMDKLRDFHMEELYLHSIARTGFVLYKDVSLIRNDGRSAGTKDDFPFGRKMLEEFRREEKKRPEEERTYSLPAHIVQQKSLFSKLKLISGGFGLGEVLKNDMLTRFAHGDDTGVSGIADISDMTEPDS